MARTKAASHVRSAIWGAAQTGADRCAHPCCSLAFGQGIGSGESKGGWRWGQALCVEQRRWRRMRLRAPERDQGVSKPECARVRVSAYVCVCVECACKCKVQVQALHGFSHAWTWFEGGDPTWGATVYVSSVSCDESRAETGVSVCWLKPCLGPRLCQCANRRGHAPAKGGSPTPPALGIPTVKFGALEIARWGVGIPK